MKFVSGLLVVAAAAGAAHAAEGIRAGKWEFSMEMQMPNMAKLPPSAHLPPGMTMGPNGMNVTRTTCLTGDKPIPDDIQASQQKGDCKVEKFDRNGPEVRWKSTCAMHDATVRAEGTARYQGDKMEATIKSIVSRAGGAPQETTRHMTGRYLGPCDAK